MNYAHLLLYTGLFSLFLFFGLVIAASMGGIGFELLAIIGGGLILALLWMLAEKLEQIDKKLDELLKEKKEE